MKPLTSLCALLQAFFTDRLMGQLNVSAHTLASYRDCFRLLLVFAQRHLHKDPVSMSVPDLDAPLVGRFLDHLEMDRNNLPRSRNARLAAIHSFFHFVSLQDPAFGAVAQRVLAIPCKRCTKEPVDFLTRMETEALLAAPDQDTWAGRRDRTFLMVAVQTGLRVSELIGLRCQDVTLGSGAHVRCTGKGRKTRCIPLRHDTVKALRAWLREQETHPTHALFPNARGMTLSRDGVEYLLAKHLAKARNQCPSLNAKRVTVHALRHTAAMTLLQHGVDRSIIALWLGHESMETTQVYLHADLQLKERALSRTEPFAGQSRRFRPSDKLLAFLQDL